jgi:GNAT superfamily N-acetyltransferase
MPEIIFRKAEWTDLDFIIQGIIASEMSGTSVLSYCSLFDLSLNDFKTILIEIFNEDICDQPWCLNHWWIGQFGTDAVCCMAIWTEAPSFQNSDFLKTQLLSFLISEKFKLAKEKLNQVAKVSIPRVIGFLQMEHLYTAECHQGKGFMKAFLGHVFSKFPKNNFEIQLMESNLKALNLYLSVGFKIKEKKYGEGLYELKLLPSDCKISLIK